MPERSADPARPYNTCAVLDSTGSLAAKYRKIHLFDVDLGERLYRESAATMAGDTPQIAVVAGIRMGFRFAMTCASPSFTGLFPRRAPTC